MYNANNPRHKLTPEEVDLAKFSFEEQGWKLAWISTLFKVARSSVLFHARVGGWVRRVSVLKRMPDEVVDAYREKKTNAYNYKFGGSYKYQKLKNEYRVQKACVHSVWVKRCSICGRILGSEATEHNH